MTSAEILRYAQNDIYRDFFSSLLVQSMHVKICVVTKAIPVTLGITFPAVIVLPV